MAISKRLPQQPRLPQVGATDYDQQLNRSLHEYFRIIASWQDFVVYRGGTGTIANGSYETTVTFASMGFTPTLEHISITLGGAADHYTQVRNITSTSFVVGTNQNIGAKQFGWRILKFNP